MTVIPTFIALARDPEAVIGILKRVQDDCDSYVIALVRDPEAVMLNLFQYQDDFWAPLKIALFYAIL